MFAKAIKDDRVRIVRKRSIQINKSFKNNRGQSRVLLSKFI